MYFVRCKLSLGVKEEIAVWIGWTNHKTSNKLPVGIRFDPNVYFPCPNTRGYGKIIQRD
jgi:hypothetical protein